MRLTCGNCRHTWEYGGKREYYVTCPNCKYSVNKLKQIDPWIWADEMIARIRIADKPPISKIYSDFLNLIALRDKRKNLADCIADKITEYCSKYNINVKSADNTIVSIRPGCPLFADAIAQSLKWNLGFVWTEKDKIHQMEKGHLSANLMGSQVNAFIVEIISQDGKPGATAIDILRNQGFKVQGVATFLQLRGKAVDEYRLRKVPLIACYVCVEEGVVKRSDPFRAEFYAQEK